MRASHAAARLPAEAPSQPASPAPEGGAWGPAARLAEHLEAVAEKTAQEAARKEQARRLLSDSPLGDAPAPPPKRTGFDVLAPDAPLPGQRNEGGLRYTLNDCEGGVLELTVALSRACDTADVAVDVQPRLLRVLVRGRLLQLHTPEAVRADQAVCQRSATTGALVVRVPLAASRGPTMLAAPAPRAAPPTSTVRLAAPGAVLAHATVVFADTDDIPPL